MELVPVPLVSTCDKKWVYKAVNAFKRLYTLKGLLVLVEKASLSKEFPSEFYNSAGGKLPHLKSRGKCED